MSHIHISLVGKETSPVYSVIRFLNPDTVYLICSNETNTQGHTILSELKGTLDDVHIEMLNPIDLVVIHKGIASLHSRFSDDDYITLNITGGTKLWALAFYKKYCDRPDTQIFILNQNNSLWNLLTDTSTNLQGLDLDTIISLYGNNTTTFTNFSNYTDADDKVMRKIEEIRHLNRNAFLKLAAALDEAKKRSFRDNTNDIFSDDSGNSIMWSKPDKAVVSILA